MTYNSKVIHEQGGSVLRIDSGGSISVSAGGTISGAGTLSTTGAVTAASVTVSAGGAFFLGTAQVMFATSAAAPSGLPVVALPGAIFFRADGANSAGYVNTTTNNAGSVWTIFSEL